MLKNGVEVTDAPAEYPVNAPSYYAVFFNDPVTGIHFELACTPLLPSILRYTRWKRLLKNIWQEHSEWEGSPRKEMSRNLPSKRQ